MTKIKLYEKSPIFKYRNWCKDHCSGDWNLIPDTLESGLEYSHIVFNDVNDAILFKLTFSVTD